MVPLACPDNENPSTGHPTGATVAPREVLIFCQYIATLDFLEAPSETEMLDPARNRMVTDVSFFHGISVKRLCTLLRGTNVSCLKVDKRIAMVPVNFPFS